MPKAGYFTTGELARLFRINKQTLFYYDKEGIFCPSHVAENGYRYYSYSQLEALEVLLDLRELQVPIQTIRDHLNHRSPEALRKLLHEKQQEIQERINHLNSMNRFIRDKLRITEEGMQVPLGEIYREDIPDEKLILTRYQAEPLHDAMEADEDKRLSAGVAAHFSRCRDLGLPNASSIGAIIPLSQITENSFTYSHFYTVIDPETLLEQDLKDAYTDSAGTFLSICDNHGYDNVLAMCHALIRYAKENRLTLDDSLYEDVLLDEMSVEGQNHYLVKVSARLIP